MTTQGDDESAAWPAVARGESGDEQGQRQDVELSELDELPDEPIPVDRFGTGAAARREPESLTQRLAEETPDVGASDPSQGQDADSDTIDDAVPPEDDVPVPAAGRLITEDDQQGNDPLDPYGNQDSFAGVEPADGLSAEESATRIVDESGEA